jgi:ribonuclease HI
MSTFQCQSCGRTFSVPEKTLEKYPSWQPKRCLKCHSATPTTGEKKRPPRRSPAGGAPRVLASQERNLTLKEVLATYTDGPKTGVFTDGAAHPNPGEGGWGAVYVVDDAIVDEARGHEPETTNNRMELQALIAGYQLLPKGTPGLVMTDSKLCVNTINEWAAVWEKNGWKRKTGAIKNLDLVQELYRLALARPEVKLSWIKAHNGYRWNEYADALATAYRRALP